MNHTPIPQNFIYPDVPPEAYKFGSGELAGTPLRDDGDWRDYLPPEEDQNIRGIESSACYVEASQHAIATLEEEQLGEADNNYSARFNAILSGGTTVGGDPLKGADSIRNDGLVPDSQMPFGDYVSSWQDFHSWKGVIESAVRAKGKEYLKKKTLKYDVVCQRFESVATKYAKLKQALKYSPCPVSVTAWYERNGMYYKPEGSIDGHLVELVYIDDKNYPYIRDTYPPYLKKLEANFNFDFGMRWSVEKKHVFLKNLYFQIMDSEVMELQKALITLGYPIPHAVTNIFGNETKKALMAFQVNSGINDDGTHFGPRTRQAMNVALNPKAPFGGDFWTFLAAFFSGV